jgi:hypothetical protein
MTGTNRDLQFPAAISAAAGSLLPAYSTNDPPPVIHGQRRIRIND